MATVRTPTRSAHLLERGEALSTLLETHSETRAGTGRLVVVAGEAGIGKTALVHTFSESVRSSERILEGACATKSPQTGAPFAFWHPDFVTLHLWLWYPNPNGIYTGMNPLMRPFNQG
jgi:Cdc6-like AAA superfamily ATPase